MTTKEYKAFEILGGAEHLAAKVAATFPEEFAETVARFNADKLDEIIEALTKKKDEKMIADFRARFEAFEKKEG